MTTCRLQAPRSAKADFVLAAELQTKLAEIMPGKVEQLQQVLKQRSSEVVLGEDGESKTSVVGISSLQLTIREMEWFLLDRKLDVDAAADKLMHLAIWREKTRSVAEAHVAEQMAQRKAYVHEHEDRSGRKVFVIRVARHAKTDDETSTLAAQVLVQRLLDDAIHSMEQSSGGQRECLLGIMDLRGFSMGNADPELANFLVDCFFKFYPKRMNELLLVDAPFMFRPTWQLIKPVLGKYAALVRFVSSRDVRDYFIDGTVPPEFM